LLHLGLVYTEYLDTQYTQENTHLIAGTELAPKIKRIAKYFGGAIGAYASYITIKNEFKESKEELKELAALKVNISSTKQQIKQLTNEKHSNNFIYKLQINKIERSHEEVTAIKEEKSRILAETSISEAKYRKNGDLKDLEIIQKYQRQLQALQPKEARAQAELQLDIDRASKFTKEISNETDEKKILELVTDDVKKSSVFNLEEL
jgi:hypothetical protein